MTEQDREQMLIEELKRRTLKPADIREIMNIPNTTAGRQRLLRLIDKLGQTYPVYEPIPNNYRIAVYTGASNVSK